LYRRAGVDSRASVLGDEQGHLDFYDPNADIPSTAQRMLVYEQHAAELAGRACRDALERAQTRPAGITHLITVSCTGFSAPGVDLQLMNGLGLPATIRRTHIGFMGCHAGVNAVAVAHAYASSDPGARVLICCVELCSLHFDHAPDAQGHVANALFADGSAAAVITQSNSDHVRIVRTGSIVLPESAELMRWYIGDQGFRMRLSPTVPGMLAEHVPPWLSRWLGESDLSISEIGSWAVHPGGPRVLGALCTGLGLDPEAVSISRAVLREHGNMSSATLFYILQRLLDADAPLPILATAFGPGLAGEAVLLS
jgi:alkylresorcinol/alkylpyrone synthase